MNLREVESAIVMSRVITMLVSITDVVLEYGSKKVLLGKNGDRELWFKIRSTGIFEIPTVELKWGKKKIRIDNVVPVDVALKVLLKKIKEINEESIDKDYQNSVADVEDLIKEEKGSGMFLFFSQKNIGMLDSELGYGGIISSNFSPILVDVNAEDLREGIQMFIVGKDRIMSIALYDAYRDAVKEVMEKMEKEKENKEKNRREDRKEDRKRSRWRLN